MKDSSTLSRPARPVALFCLALALATLAACGSDATNDTGSAAATSQAAPASSPGDDPASSSATDAATAMLPTDFPSDVPLPEDVVLVSATTTSGGGYAIEYKFASPAEEVIADYRDAVANAGYAVPKGAGVFTAAGDDWTIEAVEFFSPSWPEGSGLGVRVTPSEPANG